MNIFVTSWSPYLSALWLDDRRKNSQIRESAQLLSNAVGNPEGCYRRTHQHHPCSLWAAAAPENAAWLLDHALWLTTLWHGYESPMELVTQFEDDPTKVHASMRMLFTNWLKTPLGQTTILEVLERPSDYQNSARNGELGVDFTDRPTVFESYRDYLSYRWSTTDKNPTWNKGERPAWYQPT
jgi:hypothetical protein